MPVESAEDSFTRFATGAAPRLNQALISVAGDAGRDAASEALLYGWQHWIGSVGWRTQPGTSTAWV